MQFSIIPVLDIKDGLAVHAVGGIRDRYQPLGTILQEGSRPIDIARAYRGRLGLSRIYIADLDAILGGPPALDLYALLAEEGFEVLLDAGLHDLAEARRFDQLSAVDLIVGLETVRGPAEALAILELVGPDRLVFSVDQFDGRPLVASPNPWGTESLSKITEMLIELGFRTLVLLDLARVGTGRGAGSVELLVRLRRSHPEITLLIGGGISRIDDIRYLRDAGADGVLLGSVLHDGRIDRAAIDSLIGRVDASGDHPSRFHS